MASSLRRRHRVILNIISRLVTLLRFNYIEILPCGNDGRFVLGLVQRYLVHAMARDVHRANDALRLIIATRSIDI